MRRIARCNLVRHIICVAYIIGLSGCQSESSFSGDGATKKKLTAPTQSDLNKFDPPVTPVPVAPPTAPVNPLPVVPPPTVQPPANNETVIQKGSFTAWAVPDRPRRGQPYYLHILVQLPTVTVGYSERDLDGMISGTDMFKQGIGKSRGYVEGYLDPPSGGFPQTFEASGSQALLKVFVPGASQPSTVDTIRVSSSQLQEEQVLYVRFGGLTY